MVTVQMHLPVRARRRLPMTRLLTYVLIIGLAILYAFPFYWMVVISLKHISELDTIPPTLIPLHPTPQNYVDALLQPGKYFPIFFKNTAIMVTLGVIGRLVS